MTKKRVEFAIRKCACCGKAFGSYTEAKYCGWKCCGALAGKRNKGVPGYAEPKLETKLKHFIEWASAM